MDDAVVNGQSVGMVELVANPAAPQQMTQEQAMRQAQALAQQANNFYMNAEKVLSDLEALHRQSKGRAMASNVTLMELTGVLRALLGLIRLHELAAQNIQTSLYRGQLGNSFMQEVLIEAMVEKNVLRDRDEIDEVSARYSIRQQAAQEVEEGKAKEDAFAQAIAAGQREMELAAEAAAPSNVVQFPGKQ